MSFRKASVKRLVVLIASPLQTASQASFDLRLPMICSIHCLPHFLVCSAQLPAQLGVIASLYSSSSVKDCRLTLSPRPFLSWWALSSPYEVLTWLWRTNHEMWAFSSCLASLPSSYSSCYPLLPLRTDTSMLHPQWILAFRTYFHMVTYSSTTVDSNWPYKSVWALFILRTSPS